MVERKLSWQIQSINIMYPYMENIKKAFLANPKLQYHVSQCRDYDCHAINKKGGDYYEYPSLSHFTNEL